MDKARKFLGITLAVVVLFPTALHIAPSKLLRLKDPSAVDPGDGLVVILNPARDRSPERVASQVFSKLRDGRYEDALRFVEAERRKDLCERERKYPVRRWSLRDREDAPRTTRLFFALFREDSMLPSNAWITLEKQASSWRTTEFESWY